MKKHREFVVCLIKMPIFLIGFLIIFFSLSMLLRYSTLSRVIGGYYDEPKNTIDVVFTGNSSTMVYWSPLQAWHNWGFTSYNFVSDGVSTWLFKYDAIEALKTQSPKLYIFDARSLLPDVIDKPANEDSNRQLAIRYTTDSVKYSKNRYDMINASALYLSSGQNIWEYQIDFIKYHDNLGAAYGWAKYFLQDYPKYELKGQVLESSYAPIKLLNYSKVTSSEQLTPNMNNVFMDLLDFCNKMNCKVLFVFSPFDLSAYPDYPARMNYVKDVLKARGYDYFDANDYYAQMDLKADEDFYNTAHVNTLGMEKYTNLLGEYLTLNYKFEDKRSNPKYEKWTQMYNVYAKQVESSKETIYELIANYTGKKD